MACGGGVGGWPGSEEVGEKARQHNQKRRATREYTRALENKACLDGTYGVVLFH